MTKRNTLDFGDYEAIAGAALRLPFISKQELMDGMVMKGIGEAERVRGVDVPMDRVVGVWSLDDWAGRGLDDFGRAEANGGHSSLSAIAHYGGGERERFAGVHVEPFMDSEGQVYYYTSGDGSHRTCAYKLRSDKVLKGAEMNPYHELPKVNFSVRERLLAQVKRHNEEIGGCCTWFR